ncbi:cullin-4B-like protein [Zopfochytrium polystomum]|nr:cullin-4B-like protein [Zopfochytrium polystomum]
MASRSSASSAGSKKRPRSSLSSTAGNNSPSASPVTQTSITDHLRPISHTATAVLSEASHRSKRHAADPISSRNSGPMLQNSHLKPSDSTGSTTSSCDANPGTNGKIGLKPAANARMGGPVKKLIVKGLKAKPQVPATFVDDTWSRLNSAVVAIYKNHSAGECLEELYPACESLCICKKADMMYSKLTDLCKNHTISEGKALKQQLESGSNSLRAANDTWTRFSTQQIMIRTIFLYLDRTHVIQAGLKPIWEFGLDFFREHIMNDPIIQPMVIQGIIKEITAERDGDQISRDLLRSLISMMLDLNVYSVGFEAPLLGQTELYYATEGDRLVSDLDKGANAAAIAGYLQHVEERLAFERDLCTPGLGYLSQGSRKGLLQVLEKQLIKRHVGVLVEKGFNVLMEENRVEDLSRMYSLFAKVGAVDDIKKAFATYVEKCGTVIVSDTTRDATMVDDLLAFKSRVEDAAPTALKEACERFINKRQNKPAEMIAKHIDAMLKAGKVSETETEAQLGQCLALFRFINGKDVFEAFYKKDLAKRLLLGKSASVDSEKSMLGKLKTECGAGFTSKLEGMFKDIDTSKDIMGSFKTSIRVMEKLGTIDLFVNVLTSGFWPTYPVSPVNLPTELAQCQQVFKDFYMSKYSGRQLTWCPSLGHCVVKAQFKKGAKELSVSLYQALVLLLFNESNTVSYTDIKTQTNLEERELKRTLQSLACGKVRVLQKSPRGKDVADTDSFEYNAAFENPLFRIKINQIQVKETVEENKTTNERVFADRQYQVDAAIVRIMKARKRLTHTMLLGELFEQLKFPIKASDLKKRIESLMEREYMERDKDDASTYIYLA